MPNRRRFILQSAALAASTGLRFARAAQAQAEIYVSPQGDDFAAGSYAAPLCTISAALGRSRNQKKRTGQPAIILLREGTYALAEPLHLGAEDTGSSAFPLRIEAFGNEHVLISGGSRLRPKWRPYRDGIYQTKLEPGTTTDQLFVNGRRQILARYPNFDPHAKYLGGTAEDVLDLARTRHYGHPSDGFIHAMQQSLWGSLHYKITGREKDGSFSLEGGWQVDRVQPMSKSLLFVEGLFEDLNAPGEWFLDPRTSVLYFYPPPGIDLNEAAVDVVRLENIITIGADGHETATGLVVRGITFRHTLRTFMKTREQLLRSDWRIFRGGAVFVGDAKGIVLEDCFFDQLGGNAIFVSGRTEDVTVTSCRIEDAGASGVCFVGKPTAARSRLLGYQQTQSVESLDRTPGPASEDYPKHCLVHDCLITRTGRFEKQTAPIQIETAQDIHVRHCSLYDVPRAGINIGDGCFGGHYIEACDVFDTVLETSDHGAFNAWGRDRWWHLRNAPEDALLSSSETRDLPTLDAVSPNLLNGNRWACEHGWDIDLDDGSSNYRIENNLCLCGGLKLREGFFRSAENNILVNNTLHIHVWPADSEDVFRRNVVFVPYRPIRPHGLGADFDLNLLHHEGLQKTVSATALQAISQQDEHSIEGDALFRSKELGDFGFAAGSPALKLGIVDLSAAVYGVQSPKLLALARKPDIPRLLRTTPATLRTVRRKDPVAWMGASARNLVGLGEMSELGAPTETGVVLEGVPESSALYAAGVRSGDLLLLINSTPIVDTTALMNFARTLKHGDNIVLHILRKQALMELGASAP